MARTHFGHWALIAALAALIGGLEAKKALLPPIVTFGDSLTDIGNTFKFSNGLVPNASVYYKGRYTNAPGNWLDYVISSKITTAVINNAYGGSTACNYKGYAPTPPVPSITNVITSWVDAYKHGANKGKKIVVLWGGHNDFLAQSKLPLLQQPTVPFKVPNCLIQSAEDILEADQQAILVLGTLAPLDQAPASTGPKAKLNKIVIAAINDVVRTAVAVLKVKYGEGRVLLWDLNAIITAGLDSAKKNSSTLGLKYPISQPCLSYTTTVQKPNTFFGKPNETRIVSGICSDPDAHAFYDLVHPTSKVHKELVAASFLKLVDGLKA